MFTNTTTTTTNTTRYWSVNIGVRSDKISKRKGGRETVEFDWRGAICALVQTEASEIGISQLESLSGEQSLTKGNKSLIQVCHFIWGGSLFCEVEKCRPEKLEN